MTTNNTSIRTANVGEWSELYALAFILTYGGVYGADKDQVKKEEVFYKVMKVIYPAITGNLSYEIKNGIIEIYENEVLVSSITPLQIKEPMEKLFKVLLTKNPGRAFHIESGDAVLSLLKKHTIKASSAVKGDLNMVMEDLETLLPSPEVGFSIKSQLGSPSTLINASMATNFVYEILDSHNNIPKSLPELGLKTIKDNVCKLNELGYKLVFRHLENKTFNKNIKLLDSNLPLQLSKLLLSYYSREGSRVSELVSKTFPLNDEENYQPVFKIKEFLSTMALGMMPNKDWNGIITSLGGLLLVKYDGDVLCYYIYNLEDFQDYLFANTKFETPSTSRYGIGQYIEAEGHIYIKLNLQIRFLK